MMRRRLQRVLSLSLVLGLTLSYVMGASVSLAAPAHATTTTSTGRVVVAGATLHDAGTGAVVVLHGFSQGPTPFNAASAWARGQTPLADGLLSTQALATMRAWGANAVRIPLSAYICQGDGTGCAATGPYLATLKMVVATARADGFYVVLALFDDAKAGSPYTDQHLHPADVAFLSTLAHTFGGDGGVLYDLLNEPSYTSDTAWAADMNAAIAAVRHAGATAPVVVETSSAPTHAVCRTAAGVNVEERASFTTAMLSALHDRQVVLSDHRYHAAVTGDATSETCILGAARGVRPYLIGEWAALPHSLIPFQCQGLTSANAASVTTAFLRWAQASGISWTAWNFEPVNTVQALAPAYTPTTFATGTWTCDDGSAAGHAAGMGAVVQHWLAAYPA